MRKLMILAVALLLCVAGWAQQALFGGASVVSPEIHSDNTVTFRLHAPEATQVKVTGDFLPTVKVDTQWGKYDAPGSAELTKNADGIWEYTTTEALAPELYSYSFYVNGVKINDPSNVFQIRDVASVTNVFIIGGDRADL